MNNITAAKQVGTLSHMTDDLEHLYSIFDLQAIQTSFRAEKNDKTGELGYFVSFSRNLAAAAGRNPNRWKYGVVIDGNRLSNKYRVEPYSFAGVANQQGKGLRIKGIRAYDTGTYQLVPVNWPAMSISKAVYEAFKEAILSQPEEYNQKKRLEFRTEPGKRPQKGRVLVERLMYNVPSGGFTISDSTIGQSAMSEIMKTTAMNEYEERIWLSSPGYVDIRGCILGIVIPRDEREAYEFSEEDPYKRMREIVRETIGPNYRVHTY